MDKLVITRLQGKICTASVSDRKVTGIILEEEDQASILNNIYIGKVQKVVAGINAAFIDLGVTVGYYSLDENKEHIFTQQGRSGKLRPGDELLVQISRDAVKCLPLICLCLGVFAFSQQAEQGLVFRQNLQTQHGRIRSGKCFWKMIL